MFQEMIRARNNLRIATAKTSYKFDAKMRATIKDLLGYRYALTAEPIKIYRQRRDLMQIIKDSDKFSDWVFGIDSSRQRQFMNNNAEWNRLRPLRIFDYVQKLADIFPPEHLTHLLASSLNHTPEEIISLYEANKGEAIQSDYDCEPTGIDLSSIRKRARTTRVQ